MSTEQKKPLQDVFLNKIRKGKTPVTVFLASGVKLQGIITWFDTFTFLLKRDNFIQLVYKHSVSTIMPSVYVSLEEEEEEE